MYATYGLSGGRGAIQKLWVGPSRNKLCYCMLSKQEVTKFSCILLYLVFETASLKVASHSDLKSNPDKS